MFLGESLRMAASSLWQHKLRSTLTVLGVIIGITSVLAVVTIGKSFEQSIVSGFNTVDDRTIFVTCNLESNEVGGGPPDCRGLGRIFSERDRQVILALPSVAAVNPEGRLPIDHLTYGNRSVPFRSIAAAESDAKAISSLAGGFLQGRVFGPDAAEVVVSNDVAILLGEGDPHVAGTNLTIHFLDQTNETVTITGVLKKETNEFVQFTSGTIYAPVQRYYRFPAQESPVTGEPVQVYDGFSVVADDPRNLDSVKLAVTEYLESGSSDASHLLVQGTVFYIASGSNIVDAIGTVFDQITLFISAIAVVSLVVGAIGIANIMLVSVTERTREIGTRMAVGAHGRDILTQFLIEAMTLSVVGG
ncbi:MAG TPA: ABC transporter permease, partial [Candidatus Thermoplasmatota archaeon]|nr:ABC transporter permease [Candidatus Thermoplasmatota archaeon]